MLTKTYKTKRSKNWDHDRVKNKYCTWFDYRNACFWEWNKSGLTTTCFTLVSISLSLNPKLSGRLIVSPRIRNQVCVQLSFWLYGEFSWQEKKQRFMSGIEAYWTYFVGHLKCIGQHPAQSFRSMNCISYHMKWRPMRWCVSSLCSNMEHSLFRHTRISLSGMWIFQDQMRGRNNTALFQTLSIPLIVVCIIILILLQVATTVYQES